MLKPNNPKLGIHQTIVLIGMCLMGGLLAGCDGSSGGAPGFNSMAPTTPTSVSQEIDARFQGLADVEPSNPSTYEVGPLDVLSISVFQVPELTTDAQVAANGTITLPLIGIINVGGKQSQQIGQEIANKLRAKYLQSPQVTVFVKAYNSQHVIVSGSVTSPGTIAMTGDTTLLSAIADAKGFNDLADTKNVMVFRRSDGRKYAARFDVSDIQTGKAEDPHLRKGDLVYVDSSDVKTWMKNLLPLVSVAGLFVALA